MEEIRNMCNSTKSKLYSLTVTASGLYRLSTGKFPSSNISSCWLAAFLYWWLPTRILQLTCPKMTGCRRLGQHRPSNSCCQWGGQRNEREILKAIPILQSGLLRFMCSTPLNVSYADFAVVRGRLDLGSVMLWFTWPRDITAVSEYKATDSLVLRK